MRPFNFSEWKAGKRVVSRAGKEVEDMRFFPNAKGIHSICGVVDEVLCLWNKDGYGRQHDLVMAPETHTGYCVLKDGRPVDLFLSKESAQAFVFKGYVLAEFTYTI